MRQSKPKIMDEKQIADLLAIRTGLEVNLVRTLMHYYERIILHSAMRGNYVTIDNLFTIYHRNNKIEIRFTEKAQKHLKKK
ncbi:hypothetical protein [Mariniplasma anaerobium]|uniref:Uncharacterized protein n=1 Tax=Mariniplasma anaerobium TaxID=2735436 RepID=A0A7U9TH99_9MOLU|nr:hypothetical protein [Mariniplasma anaerobium]BCR35197.1 hypothetical protein MPAN_000900 [Mariniplasma anaerobium]